MKKIYLISLLLLSSFICYSQTDNINQYLDDAGRTEAKNIIKTDFAEFLQANIPFIWEHRFTKNMSLQGGIGILTHSFFKPVFTPKSSRTSYYNDLKGGYSLYVQPVFYYNGFESFHLGIPLRYKRHGNQVYSFEYSLAIGKQWFLGRHLALDIEAGFGINSETTLDEVSYIYNPDIIDRTIGINKFNTRLVFPVSVKIGYVL
jgi:hypothetical protein